MPVDNYVAAEILATCHALGSQTRGEYVKSADCLNCLKDLILYLRRDNEDHSILRQLGEINLLQTDLLPLLKHYPNHKDIFNFTLRLLVILTNPTFLLYKEEIPVEKLALNVYITLTSHLQNYKQAFTDEKVWVSLHDNLQELLLTKNDDRDEDDRLNIERILIIIRNVLHIPPSDLDKDRTEDDVTQHDQVLWAIHLSKMDDLILYMLQNEDEHQYCLHLIEIISLVLREQSPKALASAGQNRSLGEKEEDERKLLSSREKETVQRNERQKKIQISHRFNSVYSVKNMKSISDRDYISHKLLTTVNNTVKFDSNKISKLIPKNRRGVQDEKITRRSTLSICLFLKEFCNSVLNSSYNLFMASVKRTLMNSRTEDHDESYFLWGMQYFLEFNRFGNFQLETISETVSVHTFHYIQTQMDTYHDMLRVDKKKVKYWSKRMHLALRAYKELLETLRSMSNSDETNTRSFAEVLKGNVFYVIEYRELLLNLLLNFDEVRFSKSFLVDLIEATHLFLKLLEQFSKGHSKLIVQKKQRKQKRKKSSKSKAKQQKITNNVQEWETLSADLSSFVNGAKELPSDIVPFDATSPLNSDEQKAEIVYKLRNLLLTKEVGTAVALLRAARDLWPEDNAFGASDIAPDQEFLMLQEIFLADIPNTNILLTEAEEPEEDSGNEILHEEMKGITTAEQRLDISDFIKRFASSKVVQPCCILLANYKQNSVTTNTSVLKLMHRIAWDCKMYCLFFQASAFVTFQKICNDVDQKYRSDLKELARFARFILSKFFEVVASNKKIFVEMLFWKNSREVYELEEGYGSYINLSNPRRKKNKKKGNVNSHEVALEEQDNIELNRIDTSMDIELSGMQ